MNPRSHQLRVAGLLAGLAAICAGGGACATEYCVHDVGELNAALAVAAAGQTTVIKLAQGTYAVHGSTIENAHDYGPLQLLGGYNADCSVRTLNPSNTAFDGGGQSDDVLLNVYGDARVEGITLRNFAGIGLALYEGEDDAYVKVASNVFSHVGIILEPRSGESFDLSFNNNLVFGYANGGWPTALFIVDDGTVHVEGNTVADNADDGIAVCGHGEVALGNNIAWNNAARDIRLSCVGDDNDPREAYFVDNLYGTLYGSETSDSYGTSHADPLFASPASGNYRLQNASPAINSGNAALSHPGVDLDGHARVVGSAIDRGAYEAAVDDTVPTTLTVTNTADSGAGSLRQAIIDANANPDFTFINFNLPGGCPQTITVPVSNLPTITHGVRIDGYSQPGSAANSATQGDNAKRCIVLDGLGARTTGLAFAGGSSDQFWLQGFVIAGFTGSGLSISGGSGSLVWGNQFGGRFNGTTLAPNGTNILLTALSSGAQIGGDYPAQRNVIDGATSNGVSITALNLFASTGNQVIGNLIGTWGGETGVLVGNATGVSVRTSGNTVRDNIIVGSGGDGVFLSGAGANGNTVEHNRIGRTDTSCAIFPAPFCFDDSAPNGRYGVRIENGSHDNLVQDNTIWNNAVMGISVGGNGKNNELSANSIYQNGSYGIDLDGSGNNDSDSDPGAVNLPNRGLNYPQFITASGGSQRGEVKGDLFSTNGSYLVQVFSSAAQDNVPNGEGEVFHRSGLALISNASPGSDGSTSFRIAFTSPTSSLAGRWIALTAIDSSGNTSEFSYSVPYQCDVIFRNGVDDTLGDQCPKP
jgi:parallel beta-helix repeat protein